MKFTILSLFPEILEVYFKHSIMKRAIQDDKISYELINIRDFANDAHARCDDEPYGGGYGMLLKPEPLSAALEHCGSPDTYTIFPTPSAKIFTQSDAKRLSSLDELILICGRYEGIDQRIIDLYVHEEISIGPYVVSSGEVASLTIIDAVYRLREGIITSESLDSESYSTDLLEYPQYTRPPEFKGLKVPDVLLSGNHEEIKKWKHEQALQKTNAVRSKSRTPKLR